MTYEQALAKAQRIANETDSSQLVYRCTDLRHADEYGVDVTLPNFAERIGERIYAEDSTFIDITPTMTYFPSSGN